jgi:hypothetical protein
VSRYGSWPLAGHRRPVPIADAATVDTPYDLAAQPAERHRVVRVPRSRRADRRLLREQTRHAQGVGGLLDRHRRRKAGQAGLVGDDVANEDVLFAVRRELGPIRADRRLEVESAAIDLEEQAGRNEALGAREDRAERVLGPWDATPAIGDSSLQVDGAAKGPRHAVAAGQDS